MHTQSLQRQPAGKAFMNGPFSFTCRKCYRKAYTAPLADTARYYLTRATGVKMNYRALTLWYACAWATVVLCFLLGCFLPTMHPLGCPISFIHG